MILTWSAECREGSSKGGCLQEGEVEVRPRSGTQVSCLLCPMPRQQELPLSSPASSCFLDRENPQGLSLGFGSGVGRKRVTHLLKAVSLAAVWIPSLTEF